MNPRLDRLPILILSPHSRCNCRCVMCDIWKSTDSREMSLDELNAHLDSIESLHVEWVVLSGGEPLMHSDLFRLCDALKIRGIRITLLSTGLLLERYAEQIVRSIDEVIVSLDGPPAVHDRIRRVPGAFERMAQGIARIHALQPDYPIKSRCTVQRLNCGSLLDTVETARRIGLSGISFLAADLTSEAFNRPGGWPQERQSSISTSEDILKREMDAVIAANHDGFIAESPAKLRRIAHRPDSAPQCNAPWVSAVIETDGTVRPCFFHAPIGKTSPSTPLLAVLNSFEAIAFRQSLDVASNPTCRQCVCSLNWRG
jgi:Fe-coproporphyrin III synthase